MPGVGDMVQTERRTTSLCHVSVVKSGPLGPPRSFSSWATKKLQGKGVPHWDGRLSLSMETGVEKVDFHHSEIPT